ncbi:Polynucleotidyl transferase- ribonuclease H-like superfamily protein [Striga hermonthica]|uniref:Polynucleotidyl transferase- ribonuclease H-like superfamily protein n=1 Tax=Striga hermonthica TaxID=68872 RepID=A0A9N7MQE3_STRHE|nr:Polynucleotidyl transferase- ribonuclease H-like superfamily protein [Striga hermonthica]
MIWGYTPNGVFSTRTAYEVLTMRETDHNRLVWKAIWRAPVAQRVRHFLWLVKRDRLFTNMERVRRHMAEDAACVFCGQLESTVHVLGDCVKACKVWLRLVPRSCKLRFFSQDVNEWMWTNVVEYFVVGLENWGTTFPIVCWRLWAWRNMTIFLNKIVLLRRSWRIFKVE